ncbi:TlpA family protein disulfide reductase [Wenyingzhuangia sp. IMCC45574]
MNIKHIAILTLGVLAFSCNKAPQPASIEGTIKNLPDYINEITLQSENGQKTIAIKEGSFKDTISFNSELVFLRLGSFGKMLFLDKDYHLAINADANDFNKTISYSGVGAKENSYINEREKISGKIFPILDSLNGLDTDAFDAYTTKIEKELNDLLAQNSQIDSHLKEMEQEGLSSFVNGLKEQYKKANKVYPSLEAGAPSPVFNDLENYKGGTTSLKDLAGNYVYIDIWATWCNPCLAQIPYLQKLEEKFHGKKIKFVSLSIDNPNAKGKWKQMIANKNMGGIQLFANGPLSFVDDYQVSGIPRFILLDKKGNIINANAPRPSDPEFEKYLAKLLK